METAKRERIRTFNVSKKKCCGKLKGRVCANGRKQRRYINKDNVSSPTVHLESLIVLLMIDAKKMRIVVTVDVKTAYLKTFMPDYVLVKVKGAATNIICQLQSNSGREEQSSIKHSMGACNPHYCGAKHLRESLGSWILN